jgi:uncharacterized membrane protein YfcA
MTPVLVLLLGVQPLTAVGTDLWFAATTKIVASRIYHSHVLIDWPVVGRLWLGSLPAALLTLLWLSHQAKRPQVDPWVITAIALSVGLSALMMLMRRGWAAPSAGAPALASGVKGLQVTLTIIAGSLLGVLVTLTSVGAGAIGATMLSYLYPQRLSPQRLIATDIVHAVPLALFAGIGHLWIGDVNFALLGMLLMGSIPGVVIGSMLSTRLPATALRRMLAVILLLVSIKMLSAVMS